MLVHLLFYYLYFLVNFAIKQKLILKSFTKVIRFKVDTTFRDTVFITKIDTVIKDSKKWKYFKIGFGSGFVVGTITNLFIKK